jgi:hypothetical protein
MIGFGSPADTVRVSEAIALMRSPWLASRPVIRDNAKQRVEFPHPVRILDFWATVENAMGVMPEAKSLRA